MMIGSALPDARAIAPDGAPGVISPNSAAAGPAKVQVGDLWFDAPTQQYVVVDVVRAAWAGGHDCSIIPVNIDVAWAAARDAGLAELVARGSLVVADEMPLVWAARAKGERLQERVAGSSLILPLSAAAAADQKSVYLLEAPTGCRSGRPRR
jgi:N-acetylglucosaminyldiphosphoundecaprenol N-acetyl-beta-D-mannosaminyltransferase